MRIPPALSAAHIKCLHRPSSQDDWLPPHPSITCPVSPNTRSARSSFFGVFITSSFNKVTQTCFQLSSCVFFHSCVLLVSSNPKFSIYSLKHYCNKRDEHESRLTFLFFFWFPLE